MAHRVLGVPVLLALLVQVALAGCSGDAEAGSAEVPELGACRVLEPDDVAGASDSTAAVDCAAAHTAETFAVGPLPDDLADASYDDPDLGAFAFRTCSRAFTGFLGADESQTMRTLLSWAWFRPSEEAWADGARWYRCDVVGGDQDSAALLALPETAEGLMSSGRPDDRWMACVVGEAVPGAPRIPCSEEHDWRAVTTIKVADEKEKDYPGDRLVEVTTRDYCGDSVSAWLGYPLEYTFAYTWFHEAEWETGNRRSVCWARTNG